jgi:hypothetical protein
MIPDELLADLKVLGDNGFVYQVAEEGGRIFIVFSGYQLPSGIYNVEKTDLLIFTTPLYPNAGFDMFWVEPNLKLSSGAVPKNADSIESYLGRSWRRFSYHPYNQRAWNPSEDNVGAFMAYVAQRLKRGD